MNISAQTGDGLTAQHLLDVRDLTAFRGDRLVLACVSLHLDAGEAIILTGPTRSGNSTLLRTISCLRTHYSRTVIRQT